MTTTTFTAYIPLRAVSGIYTTGLTTTQAKMSWRPTGTVPIGYLDGKPVDINPQWFQHFRALGTQKLGGRTFASLPDVADQITRTQVSDLITAAQDQWTASLAQSVQALIEVVNGLTSTAAVPTVVLARQETNTPTGSIFGETGGGSGE